MSRHADLSSFMNCAYDNIHMDVDVICWRRKNGRKRKEELFPMCVAKNKLHKRLFNTWENLF